jgi:phage shock protein E
MSGFRNITRVMYALVAILTVLVGYSVMAANDQEAAKLAWPMIEDGALLIDVRSAEEFAEGHIEGATNIDWDNTDALIATIGDDKHRPVVVYCRSGNRAGKSASELSARGYTSVFNASGLEALKATKP